MQLVEFSKEDPSNPRVWSKWKKLSTIAIIASMASKSHVLILPFWTDNSIVLSPLGSSMFAPGIKQIAESLQASENGIIACQTGFVCMLGIGPLILAPLSETFGRKPLYLVCFTAFTLLQIPTALAKTLPVLITLRTFAGLFCCMFPSLISYW